MAQQEQETGKRKGYGGKWKKWLGIYLAVGAVAYFVIFLVLSHHGGAGGGFGY
ncbi:MAG TPA: hypothetical protein VGH10_08695 [Actinomycetota bacterium]|jgi:hypothetical protein